MRVHRSVVAASCAMLGLGWAMASWVVLPTLAPRPISGLFWHKILSALLTAGFVIALFFFLRAGLGARPTLGVIHGAGGNCEASGRTTTKIRPPPPTPAGVRKRPAAWVTRSGVTPR